MDNIKTWTYEKFTDIVTYVSGPATISKFLEEGTLTPEEVCFSFYVFLTFISSFKLVICWY